jgi:4-hydroxybutyrate CoA-transferase
MKAHPAESWSALYARRLMSAGEAVSHVKSGDRVYLPGGQQVGLLLAALLGHAENVADVVVEGRFHQDFPWYSDYLDGHLRPHVLFASRYSREAVNAGQADFQPWWVCGGHKALDDGRPDARALDVTFVSVTPPNEAGYCCFGAALWDAKTTISRSAMTIAAVNQNIPRTFGDTWVHVSEIDWFVEDDSPAPEASYVYPPPDPWDRPIAEHVASLIRDGDIIQIGTGSTSGNIPGIGVLDSKRDLGYFSELTVRGIVDLVKRGVITSRYLPNHPGKVVTTTAGNSVADIQFINDNPMFEFYPVEYMHDPRVIGQIENMVAINNVLSVDLGGQIVSGTLGSRIWSGTGGQLSYALGAYLSKGGRSISVLPSTAKGGTVSRIVPQLALGDAVTIPRDIADIVVSEYGVARLLNKTLRERANELIGIAHPDFRAELRRAASTT